MIFYTSDQHFDHKRIITLCNRPFDNLEHMQEVMIDNWNTAVKPKDHVYIIGDFAFNKQTFERITPTLNGHKHFIMGNHDKKVLNRGGLNECTIIPNNIHTITDCNRKVVMCHYPLYSWEGFYKGSIHLHGHAHHNIGRSFKERAYDVGVDGWNFSPVTLEEILNDSVK